MKKRILVLAGLVGLPIVVLVASHPFGKKSDPEAVPSLVMSGIESQVADKLQNLRTEVKEDPLSSEKWGKFGMNLHIHGLKQEAVISYRKASDLNSEEFRWPYFCGILLEETNLQEAGPWFDRARRIRPDYVPLLVRIGNLRLHSGYMGGAAEIFEQAIQLDPHRSHAYLGLARIALMQERIQDGRTYLEKARAFNPAHSEVHNLLATVYRRTGETAKAEQEQQAASNLPERTAIADPVYASLVDEGVSSYWFRVRGRTYLEAGRYEQAVREFQAAMKWKPDEEAYNNLGAALEKTGKLDEAIELYKKSLAVNPTALAYSNLGSAYGKLGRLQDSIDASKKSIELKSKNPEAFFNLGIAYFKMGSWNQALDPLRQAVRGRPGDARARFALVQCLLASGDRKSATHEWKILRQMNPALGQKLQGNFE